MNSTYTGLGKRKTSVARVFLKEGSGIITINGKFLENFFASIGEEKELLTKAFILVDLEASYDISVKVRGGGVSSQFDAIKLAISKAICTINPTYRSILKMESLLTRDSRIKERRKYGLKKARKASQYSKR
jgi:small subunit ribosomal protein S9